MNKILSVNEVIISQRNVYIVKENYVIKITVVPRKNTRRTRWNE